MDLVALGIQWTRFGLVVDLPAAAPAGLPPWQLLPSHGLALAWLALALACAPRERRILGWAGLALAIRLLVPPWTLMGVHYPWRTLVDAMGITGPNPHYGSGWTGLMGPLWWLSGFRADHVLHVNPWLGAATVLFGGALLRRDGRPPSHAALALLATLPVHALLSRTETPFVLAALLQVTGVGGALRGDRRGAWLAAASAALLAHLRPLQIPSAVLPVALLLLQRRWAPAGVALAAILTRVAAVLGLDLGRSSVVADTLDVRPAEVLGPGGALPITDPWAFPLGLTALAAVGSWHALRRGGDPVARVALAGVLLCALPYVGFHRPTDVLRFQLPAMIWAALLAARALDALPHRARLAGLAAVAVAAPLASRPLGPLPTWVPENALLLRVSAGLPPEAVVWYDDRHDRDGDLARWMAGAGRGTWRPRDGGDPSPGHLRWIGRADAAGGGDEPCTLAPLALGATVARGLGVEPLDGAPVTFGLHRVTRCPTDP